MANPVRRADTVVDQFDQALDREVERRRVLHASVVRGLEARGVEAVRILLVLGGAPGQPGNIPGLYDDDGNYITRADAELWIERQEKKALRRQLWRYLSLLFMTSVAALASFVAALEGCALHR